MQTTEREEEQMQRFQDGSGMLEEPETWGVHLGRWAEAGQVPGGPAGHYQNLDFIQVMGNLLATHVP